MKVPLHYGEDSIELEVPKENLAGFLQPREIESVSNANVLDNAVRRGQSEFVNQTIGRCVGLLLPDGTRDLPLVDMLPLLLPLLCDAKKVLFFICTGSHDSHTTSNSEIIDILHSQTILAGINEYEIISHDCQKAAFSEACSTQRGTEVLSNARLNEVNVFLALSDVKHHYFAGYSNPSKNIVPGLCAYKTIEQNHSLTFDDRSRAGAHPWHPNPSRRDNPLAADQLEAMRSIIGDRSFWALNVITHLGIVQWADFGLAESVSACAFQQADEWNVHIVEPVDTMIVSPGGLPNDVDLYIAQRALELTTSVVRDGGKILFLAACPNGIGSELTKEHFEKKMRMTPEVILQQTREQYRLFEHKPYRFAKLIRRLDRLWLYTLMDSTLVQSINMEPCSDPQALINLWLAQKEGTKILIIDGANKLLLTPTS